MEQTFVWVLNMNIQLHKFHEHRMETLKGFIFLFFQQFMTY